MAGSLDSSPKALSAENCLTTIKTMAKRITPEIISKVIFANLNPACDKKVGAFEKELSYSSGFASFALVKSIASIVFSSIIKLINQQHLGK